MRSPPTVCCGFVAMATVDLDDGTGPHLRRISRTFASEQACRAFVGLAKADYPDAYLHRVMRAERGKRAGVIV